MYHHINNLCTKYFTSVQPNTHGHCKDTILLLCSGIIFYNLSKPILPILYLYYIIIYPLFIKTRQKSLQNNWLPKFAKESSLNQFKGRNESELFQNYSKSQICSYNDLLAIISHKIVDPSGCIHPKLFQVPEIVITNIY